MANIRALNKEKYNISNYRFRELYYFCLQYDEWQEALKELRNPLKGVQYSAMPSSGVPGNPTEKAALKSSEFSHKCAMIEAAASAADPEFYDFIIYAVTHENVTFKFLKSQKNMPCERDRYYNSRRKFYYFLDRLLRNKEGES